MTERQSFDVVRTEPGFELRRYPAHVLAETTVRNQSFEDAGNRAFRALFGYITGANASRESVEMTAPVVQARSTRIAMTAPVVQRGDREDFVVAFVLPASMTEATAPVPTGPGVTLRTVPASLVAVSSFSGWWTRASFEAERSALLKSVAAAGLTVQGEPRFARFNSPYTPWFLRHNEVLVDVADLE